MNKKWAALNKQQEKLAEAKREFAAYMEKQRESTASNQNISDKMSNSDM